MAARLLALFCFGFLVTFAALMAAAEPAGAPREVAAGQVFEGLVLPLSDVVKPRSPGADEDGLKIARVLKAGDGKTYSLVKDHAARKFFLDDELLRRPMRLTAEVIPGTQMLVVKRTQSLIDGKLHDVDYWCEKCQLPATEPGLCKCCGEPVVLRELPVVPGPPPKPAKP